ncbi:hypothetical protein JCM5353_001247 [Sporobolomyces roseus]
MPQSQEERLQALWSQYRELLVWNNENRRDYKKYEAYWAGQAEQKLKELVDLAKSFRGLSFRIRHRSGHEWFEYVKHSNCYYRLKEDGLIESSPENELALIWADYKDMKENGRRVEAQTVLGKLIVAGRRVHERFHLPLRTHRLDSGHVLVEYVAGTGHFLGFVNLVPRDDQFTDEERDCIAVQRSIGHRTCRAHGINRLEWLVAHN